MTIGIAATPEQQHQLTVKGIATTVSVSWVSSTNELLHLNADTLVDCTFSEAKLPITNKPFLFHSPVYTLAELGAKEKTGRFCAWNTFLERPLWEVAVVNSNDTTWLNEIAETLGRKFCIVQDVPGLVGPRIVSNIINEARYALQEGISSQVGVDLAMKLGMAYPYGPFEWANKIGVDNINALLIKLTEKQSFYQPVATKSE